MLFAKIMTLDQGEDAECALAHEHHRQRHGTNIDKNESKIDAKPVQGRRACQKRMDAVLDQHHCSLLQSPQNILSSKQQKRPPK